MSGAERLLREPLEVINTTPSVERGAFNEEVTTDTPAIVKERGYLTTESTRDLGVDVTDEFHTTSRWIVLLARTTVAVAGSRIRHAEGTFEIEGDPMPVRAPVGAPVRFYVANLSRVSADLAVPRAGV
jgi:hypothetical protein